MGKNFFEISLGIFFIFNFFYHFKKHSLRIHNQPLLIFVIIAWVTFFINFFIHHFPLLPALLYLFRLSILLSFFILPPPKPTKNIFILVLFANVIFGFIQYFIWPDFTYFNSLNWDPHLYRLVSTFFDPTFTGLIYLMFLIYLFFNYRNYFLLTPIYLAMVLTYSRSTFLCFAIAFIFISIKLKKPTIGIISTILILTTMLLLPRLEGEGTKLERTSSIKAKIENYKEGISVFTKSPIIGFGYDNLFYVRQISNPNSHANSGFDGSLLTILTTTGIIGFIPFCLGLKEYYKKSNLFHKSLLLAIFVHSLFANSLLYPWILIFLVLI